MIGSVPLSTQGEAAKGSERLHFNVIRKNISWNSVLNVANLHSPNAMFNTELLTVDYALTVDSSLCVRSTSSTRSSSDPLVKEVQSLQHSSAKPGAARFMG